MWKVLKWHLFRNGRNIYEGENVKLPLCLTDLTPLLYLNSIYSKTHAVKSKQSYMLNSCIYIIFLFFFCQLSSCYMFAILMCYLCFCRLWFMPSMNVALVVASGWCELWSAGLEPNWPVVVGHSFYINN